MSGQDGAKYYKIRVIGHRMNEMHLRIKCTMKMEKLKKLYANRNEVDVNVLRFLFDGRRVKDEDTAQTLEIEEGDVIEVFQHQHGGYGGHGFR